MMGTFKSADDLANLDEACQQIPANVASGTTTIIAKLSQYIRTKDELPDFCRALH
jgi:hypothetical protein